MMGVHVSVVGRVEKRAVAGGYQLLQREHGHVDEKLLALLALAAKPTESPLDCAIIYRRAGVAEWQTRRTQTNLSARRETGDVELLKFGETSNGNPEPSPKRCFGKV